MTRRQIDEDTFDAAVPVETLSDILQGEQHAAILEAEARHRALLSASVPEYHLPELPPRSPRVQSAADPWPGHLGLEEQRELGADGPPELWQALTAETRGRLVGLVDYIIAICPRPADARLGAQRRDKLVSVVGAVINALARGQVLDGLAGEDATFCAHFIGADRDERDAWRDVGRDLYQHVAPRDMQLFRQLFTRLDRQTEAGAVETIRGAVERAIARVRQRWSAQPADERA